VDTEALRLGPDLIVTQDLCHVLAASPTFASRWRNRCAAEVLCLNRRIWATCGATFCGRRETGRGWQAEKLLKDIGERLALAATAN